MIKAIVLMVLTVLVCSAQPEIEWARCYGGSSYDEEAEICNASDGGYYICGRSASTDGDVSGNNGDRDIWVLKIDSTGAIIWEDSFGGSAEDGANAIIETSSGNVIVGGYTRSNDGDVTLLRGILDYWIICLNSEGVLLWQQSYGGSSVERILDIIELHNGDLLVSGYSRSTDGQVTGNHGSSDFWILRLDSDGNLLWEKSLGGSGSDIAYAGAQELPDHSLIVAGSSTSSDGDLDLNYGEEDFWCVRLDSLGSLIWERNYGGSLADYANDLILTPTDDILIVGRTSSSDHDVSTNFGGRDFWLLMIDNSGEIIMENSYGGSLDDEAVNVVPTSDEGFVIVGKSSSDDGDVGFNHGTVDIWIIGIDSLCSLSWESSLGGSNTDYATTLVQTSDSGLVVCGWTSSVNGDVIGNHGSSDYWVVKLSEYGLDVSEIQNVPQTPGITCFPNPFNSSMKIEIPQGSQGVEIYDVSGRLIHSSENIIGQQSINWTPQSDVASGVYLVSAIGTSQSNFTRVVYIE